MLTLNDWINSSGKYPERANSPELTQEVKDNATILMAKVNQLLQLLGIASIKVSSGFRPAAVNAATPGSAKKSGHMIGKAIDFVDVDGKIKNIVEARPDILRSLGMFMEDRSATPTWCHVDYIDRADRPSRVFKP